MVQICRTDFRRRVRTEGAYFTAGTFSGTQELFFLVTLGGDVSPPEEAGLNLDPETILVPALYFYLVLFYSSCKPVSSCSQVWSFFFFFFCGSETTGRKRSVKFWTSQNFIKCPTVFRGIKNKLKRLCSVSKAASFKSYHALSNCIIFVHSKQNNTEQEPSVPRHQLVSPQIQRLYDGGNPNQELNPGTGTA